MGRPIVQTQMSKVTSAVGRAAALALALAGLSTGAAKAVPSFAVQTGQPCNACHVGGFGPQLTPFGREFKMGGYTMRAKPFNLPVSMMGVASYVHTQKPQDPPAPQFGDNNNTTLDQASLFLAGGFGHIGGFFQMTYDGIARAFSWDNLDVRATTQATIQGKSAVLGVSINNNPTIQDGWNTLPGWGYPYTGSDLQPGPAAAPVLAGAFAQNVLGATGYIWWNSQVYAELGAYGSNSPGLLHTMGVDPAETSKIHGMAPYARLAYQRTVGLGNAEVGVFGFQSNVYPGRDDSTGMTDRYRDLGVDASYQWFGANQDVWTVNARYIAEHQTLDASNALGLAANRTNTLNDARADVTYYWKNWIGGSVGAFNTWGSRDTLAYADNATAKPDSSGVMLQLDATPWGGTGGPVGPRFNMRVGLQYILYSRFNGASHNYDGMGHNASDNNSLRVFTWFAF